VQVGTSFAFTRESGLAPEAKQFVLRKVLDGDLSVFTDPVASPTGFPFKVRRCCFAWVSGGWWLTGWGQVLELDDSLSSKDHYEKRPRVCNLGYLRTPYQRTDGKIAYRCASEPIEDYLKKDGGALRSFPPF
jgi:nitronate monooxygenase